MNIFLTGACADSGSPHVEFRVEGATGTHTVSHEMPPKFVREFAGLLLHDPFPQRSGALSFKVVEAATILDGRRVSQVTVQIEKGKSRVKRAVEVPEQVRSRIEAIWQQGTVRQAKKVWWQFWKVRI